MKFMQGQNRKQIYLLPVSLDESIDPNNEIRIMDLSQNGHPAYYPSGLLKLCIYRYLNKVRYPRDLGRV